MRILLILGALSVSLLYYGGFYQWVHQPVSALCHATNPFSGTVCDYPVSDGEKVKVTLLLENEGLHRVKAALYGDETLAPLQPGQRVSGAAYWQDAAVIHDTDVTTFTSRGVHVLLYRGTDLIISDGAEGSWRYLPQRFAKAIKDKLVLIYKDDPVCAAFMTAELTGDRSGMAAADYTKLSEVGLAHLFAVSGLHCAFLVSLLGFLIPTGRRRLFAGTAIGVLLFYMMAVGLTPSVVRACIMQIFLLTAPLFKRESDGMTSLGAALLVILLVNPFAIGSVSLQLSFAATLGLVWLAPKMMDAWGRAGEKWPGAFRAALRFLLANGAATVSALAFTVPLTAYYFNILTLVSPLSNLLIVWAAGWNFMLGFVTVLIGFISLPAAQVLSAFSAILIYYVRAVVGVLIKIPYHAVYFTNRLLKYWLIYAYGMVSVCCLTRPRRGKYALATGLAAVALAATVVLNAQSYYAGDLNMVTLNVGQGECVLLYSRHEAALVDCGSSTSGTNAGAIAADLLETLGIRALDEVVVTHYHADHTDGLEDLMARISVKDIYLPDIEDTGGVREKITAMAAACGSKISFVEEAAHCSIGTAEMTVYPPVGEGDSNEQGLSILCSLRQFDALITGDMDGDTEEKLAETYALPDIEVLLVGHHGSRNSSSKAFLSAVEPETAVISVGRNNSYGHPADAALYRLQATGTAVYRTDLQGNIRITVKKGDS